MSKFARQRRVKPSYPTRSQMLAQPGLLPEHVPPAWRDMISKGGLTVAFLVSGLAGVPVGCAREPTTPGAAVAPATATSQVFSAGTIVAPIFEHGTGRATTGCVVIAPPVFITEEEARQVIIEELAKVGLKMSAKDVELKDVSIRPKKLGVVSKDGKSDVGIVAGDPRPLVVDLMDPEKHIAIEFISEADYVALGEISMSSVQIYDFKKVGQDVADQVKSGQNPNRFGVFYDPTGLAQIRSPSAEERQGKTEKEIQELYNQMRTQGRAAAEKASREELRKQVRDFADWLHQQGVI